MLCADSLNCVGFKFDEMTKHCETSNGCVRLTNTTTSLRSETARRRRTKVFAKKIRQDLALGEWHNQTFNSGSEEVGANSGTKA